MSSINCSRVADHIINWLNDYISNIPSVEGYILGVSGGVDSALVAALCARTGKKVLLLNMPIRQVGSEYNRAKKQITDLEAKYPNVKGIEVNLDASLEALENAVPKEVSQHDLAMANSRSRLRMMTLYAVGQTHNLIVVGTGNKIEDFGIGFFTKYGDGGVDVQPIGDLLKSEVYQLSEYLEVIPEILAAKPTDGLWGDNRTDEDQIGASYDELEFIMNNPDKTDLNERQKEVKAIYDRLNRINRHKMTLIPVCNLSDVK